MAARKLCILTPDPSEATRNPEWPAQAEMLGALFAERGITLALQPWTDEAPLDRFDLTVPLIAWGYHRRFAQWLASLDRWEHEQAACANPVRLLRWNCDKAYLLQLADEGIAIVPTIISQALASDDLASAARHFGSDRLVIKPPASAGSDATYVLAPADAIPADAAARRMLVQPFLPTIQSEGEYSLFLFGGRYSHAILKQVKPGDFRVQPQFGGSYTTIDPPAEAISLAESALMQAALRGGSAPIDYARVDLVRGLDGQFCLMEMELIEPFLFLAAAPDGGARFADVIASRMG